MAITAAQLKQAWRDAQQEAPGLSAFSKDVLQTNAGAIDAWIDANQASFNNALSDPFKTNATAGQKAVLFMWVLIRRFRG